MIPIRVREFPGSIPGAALDDRSQNVDLFTKHQRFVNDRQGLLRELNPGPGVGTSASEQVWHQHP